MLILLASASICTADDFEAALLRKFKKQNQHAGTQVMLQVEKNLKQALVLGPAEPEKAYLLLRETQFMLDASDTVSYLDRAILMRKLEDGFRDAKARLDSKKQLVRTPPPVKPNVVAGPILFQPGFGSHLSRSSMQVTPVVGPGRRWVRIGISGNFFFGLR